MSSFTSYFVIALVFTNTIIAAGCTSQNQSSVPVAQVSPAATGSPVPESSLAPTETSNGTSPVPAAAHPLEAAPAVLTTVEIPAGSIAQYYPYTLNGKTGVIPLTLSTSIYVDYQKKAEPSAIGGNGSYYLAYVNDPEQQPSIAALAAAIKGITANPSDEARIATSLVQHIPSYDGPVHQYPYEVLYSGEGTSGEKSLLLASLLNNLGLGSAVFFFVDEDHMTAGISASAPYDYDGTGYALIETTQPTIITDDSSALPSGRLHSTPEVMVIGNGQSMETVARDYMDAGAWIDAEKNSDHLSDMQYRQWEALDAKYDLSYFTCQKCKLSVTPSA
jgi:hypothetical protein